MSCGVSCRCGLDPILLWLCIGQQLQLQFSPYPGNFHMPQVQPWKKQKKAKNKETKSVWTGCLHFTWAHSHLWKHNFCKTLTTRGIRHSSINQWVVTSPLTRNPEPPLDKPYPPWKQRIETRGITILQPVEGTQEQKIRRKMRRQKNVLDKETR